MRPHIPLTIATLGLAIAAPLYAQDEETAQTEPDVSQESEWVEDNADLTGLMALMLEAQQSIEGVEAYACPVDETGAEQLDPEADDPASEITPPVQDYEPKPALWKITDEDTTIHLFGTFHILPEWLKWRTPLIDRAIAESDELVLETSDEDFGFNLPQTESGDTDPDADADAEMSEFEQRIFELVFNNMPEKPIFARISEHNKSKLAKMVLDAGLGLEEANFMPPMLLMFTFGVAGSMELGSSPVLGVETVLSEEFTNTGRPILSIEDPMEVLDNLLKVDEEILIASFDASLDMWDPCVTLEEEVFWGMEHAWAKGEIETLQMTFEEEDPLAEQMNKVLLTDRNQRWTAWIKERMAQPGTLMLAVGAGHMAGPDSLILMLDAEGITVERVQ